MQNYSLPENGVKDKYWQKMGQKENFGGGRNYILIVLVIPWLYTFVKANQSIHLKRKILVYVNYTWKYFEVFEKN